MLPWNHGPSFAAWFTHEMQDLSLNAKGMRVLLIGDDSSGGLLSVREVLTGVPEYVGAFVEQKVVRPGKRA